MVTVRRFCNENYVENIEITELLKDIELIIFFSEFIEMKTNAKRLGKIFFHDWILNQSDWETILKPIFKNKEYISKADFDNIKKIAKSMNIITRVSTAKECNKKRF